MDEGRSVESSKIRPIIRTVVAVLLFLFYMFPFFMIVLNSYYKAAAQLRRQEGIHD